MRKRVSKGNGLGRGPDGDSQLKGRRCPWGSEAPKGRGAGRAWGPRKLRDATPFSRPTLPALAISFLFS